MGVKRYSTEQIIVKLREAEIEMARGMKVPEVCRTLGISEQTFYRWRKRYGGLNRSEVRRLKSLDQENARLKNWTRKDWRRMISQTQRVFASCTKGQFVSYFKRQKQGLEPVSSRDRDPQTTCPRPSSCDWLGSRLSSDSWDWAARGRKKARPHLPRSSMQTLCRSSRQGG